MKKNVKTVTGDNIVSIPDIPKISKLSQLKQTDGQIETQPKTLSQFFGESIQGKYHTTDETEYELYLKELNKTDLQRHAIKCGLTPKDDRLRLTQSLLREFRRVVASYKPLPIFKSKGKPLSKEQINFLAGGR